MFFAQLFVPFVMTDDTTGGAPLIPGLTLIER
jgi:hypothetical protein